MNKKSVFSFIALLAVIAIGFIVRYQFVVIDSEYEGTIRDYSINEKVIVKIDAKKNNRDIIDNHITITTYKDIINANIAFYKRDNGSDAIILRKEDGKSVEVGEVFFMDDNSIKIVLYDNRVIDAVRK